MSLAVYDNNMHIELFGKRENQESLREKKEMLRHVRIQTDYVYNSVTNPSVV